MKQNLVKYVENAGIVGAGGAGFPTAIKVDAKCEYVIVNAAECEPLLRVDQQLMEYKAREIIRALDSVVENTNSIKGIIGIKKKHKNAISVLKEEIKNKAKLEIFELENFYPAGDEHVLVYEVTKRTIPEGGIPLNVGVVVLNSETLLNIDLAVEKQLPVIDKYVTVTGEVYNPITVKVPIGLSFAEMIKLAGGSKNDEYIVIDGGPMMGKVIEDMSTPITKVTKGLIILNKNHPVVVSKKKKVELTLHQAKSACMQCNFCSELCPRRLLGNSIEPHKLMRIASYGGTMDVKTSSTVAFLCSECRLCEYVCVMGLQPWNVNKMIKDLLIENGIKNPNCKKNLLPDDFRDYKKYPVNKLIINLGLEDYDVNAPLIDIKEKFGEVELLMQQHIGAPSIPIVKLGEYVKRGQQIGKVQLDKLGACIHASIDGVVEYVDQEKIVIKTV